MVVKLDDSFLKIVSSKLDFIGFVAFASAAVMILMALQYGGIDYPWKSAMVIGLLCGGGITMALFLVWEHRVGDGAMVPIPVLRQREIWAACLTIFFMFAMTFVSSYYLPIYFQSVKGATALASGVDMLPQILAQLVSAVLSGFLVQKLGYYLPFAVCCAVLSTIGNGLLSTLTRQTPVAKWAGFQALLGFGRGWGMQMSFLAIQACAPPELVSIATAILIFSQTLSGAVSTAISNVIFNGVLRQELISRVPHLSSSMIINAGASSVRDVTPKEDLPAVLESYAKGVDATFYFATATSACMFIVSWGIGWKDIRKKKTES
ncbi:hypothetical protein QQX98_005083 [Neonectria punicea]|uniref:Major facilitator superfamily (MFS) profile domain-containing protein n=1 Tax=Neonectria punicea TaxID=979145 RepID=A0ABR1H6U8_9HYPO